MTPSSGTVDFVGAAVRVAVGAFGVAVGGMSVGEAAGSPHPTKSSAINPTPNICSNNFSLFICFSNIYPIISTKVIVLRKSFICRSLITLSSKL
jgi:hypothetical protein